MAYDTYIAQGQFTADGNPKVLNLRGDVDWMEIYNYTQMATQQSTGRGVKFFWQRGMAADTGIEYKKTNSTDALNGVTLSSGGFTLIDTSVGGYFPGLSQVAVTAVSNANPPIVSTGNTAGLLSGDVVRLYQITSAEQLGAMDFSVDTIVANTSFRLPYMAQIVAGTSGFYSKVRFDPSIYPFKPSKYWITKLTQASSAVVTLSVKHQLKVGEAVRFIVPAAFGMIEMNELVGNITAIDQSTATTNTITVDIDSSAFTAFAFPLSGAVPFTSALCIPFGETANSAIADPNLLDDSVFNNNILGMYLAAGAQSPAGSSNDVIYWRAGKSFSNTIG